VTVLGYVVCEAGALPEPRPLVRALVIHDIPVRSWEHKRLTGIVI